MQAGAPGPVTALSNTTPTWHLPEGQELGAGGTILHDFVSGRNMWGLKHEGPQEGQLLLPTLD